MSRTTLSPARRLARRASRHGATLLVAAALLVPLPAAAQDAGGPAALPERVALACDALFGGAVATPIAGEATGTVAPYDQVPFDLLAIDTLISHEEAVIAVATVAEAGATHPELATAAADLRASAAGSLDQLRAWRDAWFPGAAPTPYEYQSALFDDSQYAAGVAPGSGEAPVLDPMLRAEALCEVAAVVPFDLAAIDMLAGELRDGAAIAVYVAGQASQPELGAAAAATGDGAATAIGQLATWRDTWFGVGVPEITPEAEGHEH